MVACWSHARRRFWEAALTKDPVAREALLRLKRLFDADRVLRECRPDERTSLRQLHVRPYVDDFLAWCRAEYETVKDCRGPLRSAFGYVVRQEAALRRFLEDGRLPLTNNQSERELRRIGDTGPPAAGAVGRAGLEPRPVGPRRPPTSSRNACPSRAGGGRRPARGALVQAGPAAAADQHAELMLERLLRRSSGKLLYPLARRSCRRADASGNSLARLDTECQLNSIGKQPA